ncbi:copper chaperone PCu(A)C [Methylobacillus gramineus]|uniref:copper chaperone PCu(A)C n=1 Tax=Methylobacillus gramineus TaxID=755169 RepID=UPI001D000DDD|nr:copper chaperone PCu(A)C [Methylobacillus gramineus]MCB5184043.1 copper chaperone PCu(A)C [Methylobacillus gramineus]
MQALIGFLILLFSMTAYAEVKVVEPWARTTAPGQKVAAVYLRMISTKDVSLVEMNSPLADKVELHEMNMDNGIMKMRPVSKLQMEAAQAIELKPGSYHLMLSGIKQAVKAGDSIPLTLIFEDKHNLRESIQITAIGRTPSSNLGIPHAH